MANKSERQVIEKVIRRLEGCDIADSHRPHLDALRIYLDTWVIPPLRLLVKEDRSKAELRHATRL